MPMKLTDERVVELLRGMTWQRDNASGTTLDSDEVAEVVALLQEVQEQRTLIDQIATKTSADIQARVDSLSSLVEENTTLRKTLEQVERRKPGTYIDFWDRETQWREAEKAKGCNCGSTTPYYHSMSCSVRR